MDAEEDKEIKKIKRDIMRTDTAFKWVMLAVLWIISFSALVANSVTANLNPFTYFNILPGTSNIDCDLIIEGDMIVGGNWTSIGEARVGNISQDALRGPEGDQGPPGTVGPMGEIGPQGEVVSFFFLFFFNFERVRKALTVQMGRMELKVYR